MSDTARPVRGDVVRVRSQEEILATLDADGTIDRLPFMPEMLRFCGQELPVAARAHKTCDTVEGGRHRKLDNCVHLLGARCDGSAHGGCEAGCLLFWREEWLEWPADPGRPIAPVTTPAADPPVTAERLRELTVRQVDGKTVYRCQATELPRASEPVRRRELWQYLADVRSGNVGAGTVVKGLSIEVFNAWQRFSARRLPRWLRLFGGRSYPFLQGTGDGSRLPVTGIKPGDLVEVRPKKEIMATLDRNNMNRWMLFDVEMLPYCGRRFRVARRVGRIIDEATGEMIKLSDCLVLDGVVCQGRYHRFCQRAVTPYWREGWLRKVEDADENPGAAENPGTDENTKSDNTSQISMKA